MSFLYEIILDSSALYIDLGNNKTVLPAHAYNLSLIKRLLKLSRSELAECYDIMAEKWSKDTDDIADVLEEWTSDENIKTLEAENPNFVYVEPKQELIEEAKPEAESQAEDKETDGEEEEVYEDPKSAIAQLYYEALKESGSDADYFSSSVFLADQNPNAVRKAVANYARNCGEEDAVLVFDDTLMKSGKSGLLLTNEFLYIGSSGRQKARIALPDINFLDVEASLLIKKVIINSFDVETDQLMKKGTIAFANLLEAVIPIAMQIKVDPEEK